MWDVHRIAGLAGIVLAAMLAVAFALDGAIMGSTGGPPMIQLDSLGPDLQRAGGSAIWPIETWLYSLQIVPFALFIGGVRSAARASGQGPLADVATLAAVLFMILHTVHNLLILSVVQVLAPAYVPGAAEAPAIEAASRGLLGLAYATFLPGGGVGGALLVLALGGFALAERRTPAFGASTAALAGVGAALSAIAYVQYAVPPALVLALLGFLAFIGWVTVVSAGLLRVEPRGVPALAAQAG